LEEKNSPHTPETLEKIKNYIEELKKEIKTSNKGITQLHRMDFTPINEREDLFEKFTMKIYKAKEKIKFLKENLRMKKGIKTLYINYHENNNYNNLSYDVENILLEGLIRNKNNIDNMPITLKNILHCITYNFNEEIKEEQKNILKCPFDCKYFLSKNRYFFLDEIKKYNIDYKNIYELKFYKDLQLYKKMVFDKYYDKYHVLITQDYFNDYYYFNFFKNI
jgi:hypothetical protein